MPIQQSYPYDGGLFARRPSLLRVVGEAIISWADHREEARSLQARKRRASPSDLPAHLRRDVGMPPLPDSLPHVWPRW